METDLKAALSFRAARVGDAKLLAELNYELIQDEGHSNPMSLPELAARMKQWLARDYKGVIFEHEGRVLAYAIYRLDSAWVYLRQFYVSREHRRQGIGRAAMRILLHSIFPPRLPVRVDVLYHNDAAHEFWRAIGFKDYAITLEMNRDGGGS